VGEYKEAGGENETRPEGPKDSFGGPLPAPRESLRERDPLGRGKSERWTAVTKTVND